MKAVPDREQHEVAGVPRLVRAPARVGSRYSARRAFRRPIDTRYSTMVSSSMHVTDLVTKGRPQPSRASLTDQEQVTMPAGSPDITALLHAHAAGDADALDRLLPYVYDELRRIARGRLRHERDDHSLATTDLVHEAFIKLMPLERVDWRSRSHFYAIASRAARLVLIDHAVRRRTTKRGGGARAVDLEEQLASAERPLDDLITLSQLLDRLEQLEPRQVRVVECRFFGGLSLDETAAALGTSSATVSRDWTFARAWLNREMAAPPPTEDAR
jgi:RNA polymerase sigma factor (TIGR02999 family)